MRRFLEKAGLLHRRPLPLAPGYRPDASDLYEFDPRDSTRVAVDLATGSFQLPEDTSQADAAVLQVDVRTPAIGAWQSPCVELTRDDGRRERHYLDRHARGTRFLDISSLLDTGEAADPSTAPGRQVRVCGVRASFGPRAQLFLFRNEPIERRRVLVLSPHPDDAEIAAYGLYKHTDSAVVTITGGDAGGNSYRHILADERAVYELKSRLRVWDSLVVPMLAGVAPGQIANLGYPDGALQQMAAEPERLFGTAKSADHGLGSRRRSLGRQLLRSGGEPTWKSLVEDLAHIVRVVAPAIIVSPHPLLDANPDHRYSSLALFEALEDATPSKPQLFLYSNHPVYHEGWPFGPPRHPSSLQPWPRTPAKVRGLYSFPLSLEDQVDKLFALEAMHDLRRSPPSITRDLEWGPLSSLMEARDAFLRHRIGPFSYFRRAVRSRELFLVHPGEDASLLRVLGADAPLLW